MASILSKLKGLVPGQTQFDRDDPRHPRHAEKPAKGAVAMLYTTRDIPFYFLSTTKCGYTFVLNLIYLIDTGRPHHDPDNIQDYRGDFHHPEGMSAEDIQASDHAFCITRDPATRFMSVYFDKLWNDASHFDFLREEMARLPGFRLGAEIDLEQHRRNCRLFIDWIERNIHGRTGIDVNRHWARQQRRQKQARVLHLRALTLDGLDWQLPWLLRDLVPDIEERMAQVSARNTAPKPFSYDDILTPEIRARIGEVYKGDAWVYNKVSDAWAAVRDGAAGAEIPRLLPAEK